MLQTGYVFISYRSFEGEFATRLGRDLLNAGVGVWLDAMDMGIHGGEDWPRRLEQGIDNCAGCICVLSPDYVESKYCLRELQRADKRGAPIIPVLLRPLPDKKTRSSSSGRSTSISSDGRSRSFMTGNMHGSKRSCGGSFRRFSGPSRTARRNI